MLVLACLVGAALLHLGHTRVPKVLPAIEQAQEIIFAIVGFVMRLAPIAVFGAMAVLIGNYGLGVIETYGKLIILCYAAAALFVTLLAVALRVVTGLSLWKFLRYIREEMLLALGTASTESVMPRVMQKLRKAGARDDAVGLVLPTGYSFNLDGASLYLSIGTLFIAQAVGVDLDPGQQITVVLVLMLTSKGMAGIPGSAFLALSATASSLGAIPAGAVALLLGVDRIMDSMRVVTNLLGNCVAVFAVSRWEGALDLERAKRVLDGETAAVGEEEPGGSARPGPTARPDVHPGPDACAGPGASAAGPEGAEQPESHDGRESPDGLEGPESPYTAAGVPVAVVAGLTEETAPEAADGRRRDTEPGPFLSHCERNGPGSLSCCPAVVQQVRPCPCSGPGPCPCPCFGAPPGAPSTSASSNPLSTSRSRSVSGSRISSAADIRAPRKCRRALRPSSVSSIRITRRFVGSGMRRTLPLASSPSTRVVTARGTTSSRSARSAMRGGASQCASVRSNRAWAGVTPSPLRSRWCFWMRCTRRVSRSSCSASRLSESGVVMREQYQDAVHCEYR